MKLVIAVVQDSDVDEILDALMLAGLKATQITSSGGFLREANVTLLMGVEEDQVHQAIAIVDQNSNARRLFVNPLMPVAPVSSSRLQQGDGNSVRVGASVFVLNVSRFARLTE